MSAKNRYGKFRKKDYVRLLEYTVWRLCREFGYVKEPQIFETELLEKNATMLFAHYGKHLCMIAVLLQENKRIVCNFFRWDIHRRNLIAFH